MNWIVAAIASAVAYGFWGYLLRAGVGENWKSILIWAVLAEFVAIALILHPTSLDFSAAKYGIGAGLCAAVGYALLLLALSKTEHTMAVPVAALYPAITVLLAWRLLGDSLTWDRLLGVGLALAAVWLLAR